VIETDRVAAPNIDDGDHAAEGANVDDGAFVDVGESTRSGSFVDDRFERQLEGDHFTIEELPQDVAAIKAFWDDNYDVHRIHFSTMTFIHGMKARKRPAP
jgi:hypothetical protein